MAVVVRQASEKAVAVSCKENSLWVVKGLTCLSDGKRTFKRLGFEVSGGRALARSAFLFKERRERGTILVRVSTRQILSHNSSLFRGVGLLGLA